MQATNRLLAAIDKLKGIPNVIVLCASNFYEGLDAAFVDRVDECLPIPRPDARVAYTLFAERLNELLSADAIAFPQLCNAHFIAGCGDCDSILDGRFPGLAEQRTRFWERSDAPQSLLWTVAEMSQNMSGRSICRLPQKAMSTQTFVRPPMIIDVLFGMAREIFDDAARNTQRPLSGIIDEGMKILEAAKERS